jgi:mannose-1-phosphate guanylyltransferase
MTAGLIGDHIGYDPFMQYGVIMAGGSGTRLWPISRGDKPKQLLRVVHGKSLLQVSYDRLRGVLPAERIFVCTASVHAPLVQADLPDLPAANILGEPVGRDTANAVGYAAAVLHKMDPDAVCAVVTADHVIQPIEAFQTALQKGFDATVDHPNALVTFGIVPTFGHTGLGYVHRGEPLVTTKKLPGVYRVLAFKEKPDKPTADRYVESGRYYWNSGMFVWRADTVLAELAAHLPDSYAGLAEIAAAWGTPQQAAVVDTVYAGLKKISVDYAIMEPASQGKGKAQVAVVEMPVQWLDVGSWTSLAETLPTDEHNNAIECPATLLIDSDDNIILSTAPDHLISTIGVSDMIIVHTPDATMICPKNESQRVKDLVGKIKEKFGERFQ